MSLRRVKRLVGNSLKELGLSGQARELELGERQHEEATPHVAEINQLQAGYRAALPEVDAYCDPFFAEFARSFSHDLDGTAGPFDLVIAPLAWSTGIYLPTSPKPTIVLNETAVMLADFFASVSLELHDKLKLRLIDRLLPFLNENEIGSWHRRDRQWRVSLLQRTAEYFLLEQRVFENLYEIYPGPLKRLHGVFRSALSLDGDLHPHLPQMRQDARDCIQELFSEDEAPSPRQAMDSRQFVFGFVGGVLNHELWHHIAEHNKHRESGPSEFLRLSQHSHLTDMFQELEADACTWMLHRQLNSLVTAVGDGDTFSGHAGLVMSQLWEVFREIEAFSAEVARFPMPIESWAGNLLLSRHSRFVEALSGSHPTMWERHLFRHAASMENLAAQDNVISVIEGFVFQHFMMLFATVLYEPAVNDQLACADEMNPRLAARSTVLERMKWAADLSPEDAFALMQCFQEDSEQPFGYQYNRSFSTEAAMEMAQRHHDFDTSNNR